MSQLRVDNSICIIIRTCACTQLHDRGYMYSTRTYIVYENYSRYSQIGKLYLADLSMCVYIGKISSKLWNVYQHNLAQSVLANNEAVHSGQH